jgi:hypothetical protein
MSVSLLFQPTTIDELEICLAQLEELGEFMPLNRRTTHQVQ